jgi:hypothetical protein
MKKKFLATLLAILTVFSFATTAQASTISAPEAEIGTQYVDLSRISATLSVSGSKATSILLVIGNSNVTKISATLQLQQRNSNGTYSDYGSSWTNTANGSSMHVSDTKTVASGGTYRLKVVITSYTSSGSSTETAYS